MPPKFCSSCGTAIETNTRFCTGCGTPVPVDGAAPAAPLKPSPPPAHVQNAYPYAQTAYAPVPKKRGGRTALIIIGSIVGFFALIIVIAIVIANIALGNTADADYYTLGNDRVTSVKAVVGMRSVSKVETAASGGVTTQTIGYSGVQSTQDDLMQYAAYLRDSDGFSVTVAYDLNVVPGSFQLAKASDEEDMIIILDVAYSQDGYTLVFTKCKGSLDSF